ETGTVTVSIDGQSIFCKQSTRNRICIYLKVIPFPDCVLVQPVSIQMREVLTGWKQHNHICSSLGTFLSDRVYWLGQLHSHVDGRVVEEQLLHVIHQILFRFFKIKGIKEDKATELSHALCQTDDAEPMIELPQNLWDILTSEKDRIPGFFEKPIQDIFV